MMKLRWVVLLAALTAFLTACPPVETPLTATLELTAAPNPVPAGGAPVALTATITAGAENVASVDFAIKDQPTALGTDSDTADNIYNFTTATPVTAATTFVATARDSGGTAIGSAEVAVTVAGPTTVTLGLTASPNPVPVGGAPVTLTATVTAGQSRVASVAFSIKGQTTPLGTDNTAPYSFTTTTPVTAATTFVATARDSSNASLATAEVAVTVSTVAGPGSGATVNATNVADINAAPVNANIVVGQNIVCDKPADQGGDPCIVLKEGQKLAAGAANITITTDIPTGPGNSDGTAVTTVIRMANNTAVEGFTFVGPDMYTAIEAASALTGPVFIRNVTLNVATSNAPIRVGSKGAVTIEGFTMLNSARSVTLSGFSSLTLRNSTLSFNLPATDTRALIISDADSTTTAALDVTVDGLTLTSNLGGPAFSPVLFSKFRAVNTNVIFRNSRVVIPAANVADGLAVNFSRGGGITSQYVIDPATSIGNSTNATNPDADTYTPGSNTARIVLTKGVN